MNHARTVTDAHAERDRRDEGDSPRRAPAWWLPVLVAAVLGVLGYVAVRLLELDRQHAVHESRIDHLERQYSTIDLKLDRLIERK